MTTHTLTVASLRLTDPAHAALNHALANLADRGDTTPCYRSDLPTSAHADERAEAVRTMCGHCPVRKECAAAGASEIQHVWGGIDRKPTGPQANGRWTEAEDDILRSHTTPKQAHLALTHRTLSGIQNRAYALGHQWQQSHKSWTKQEDRIIRAHTDSRKAAEKLPGRTQAAVVQRSQVIGHRFHRRDAWTDQEHTALLSATTLAEARTLLPGRSESAIRNRARLHGHAFQPRKDAA